MSKPLFTTKHYKAIAEAINQAVSEERELYKKSDDYVEYSNRRSGIERLKMLLEALLARDNPKYDQSKFVRLLKKS